MEQGIEIIISFSTREKGRIEICLTPCREYIRRKGGFPDQVFILHTMTTGPVSDFNGFLFGGKEHPVDGVHLLPGIAGQQTVYFQIPVASEYDPALPDQGPDLSASFCGRDVLYIVRDHLCHYGSKLPSFPGTCNPEIAVLYRV